MGRQAPASPRRVEIRGDGRGLLRERHVVPIEDGVQCICWISLQGLEQRIQVGRRWALLRDELKRLVVGGLGGEAGDEDLSDLGA
jgi:hypothetical protein